MAFSEAERDGEPGFHLADQVKEVARIVLETALQELGVPWVGHVVWNADGSDADTSREWRRVRDALMAEPAPTPTEAERRLNEVLIGDPDTMEIPDGYVAAEFSPGRWHPWGVGKSLRTPRLT
jgi:hypothetical protein